MSEINVTMETKSSCNCSYTIYLKVDLMLLIKLKLVGELLFSRFRSLNFLVSFQLTDFSVKICH